MKITNKANLPKPIYDVLTSKFYDGDWDNNTYSATELLNDPKYIFLMRRHRKEITIDASDLFYQTWGNLMHEWLERVNEGEGFKEERLSADINGISVKGKPDFYSVEDGEKIIYDFKLTSVWSYIYKSSFEKWAQQLNIYKYLFHKSGFETDNLKVIAMFRDWSKTKYETERDYPKQCEIIDMPAWSISDTEGFLISRTEEMKKYRDTEDDAIPECIRENRWQTDDTYAVKKKNRKKALRVFDTRQDAEEYAMTHKDTNKLYIEDRIGECKRCTQYCDIKEFCSFGREL